MKLLDLRYQAAALVAMNWRIRLRLPYITALAREIGLIHKSDKR